MLLQLHVIHPRVGGGGGRNREIVFIVGLIFTEPFLDQRDDLCVLRVIALLQEVDNVREITPAIRC